jgi:hypothetical protein
MRHSTTYAECNNPRTCDFTSPLPDSPLLEMESAEAQRQNELAELQTRIADEARALAANASSAHPVSPVQPRQFDCECGRQIPGNICSAMWVKSPRTGRIALVASDQLDNLPPRVRGRIHDVDLYGTRFGDKTAPFTTHELSVIFRIAKSVTDTVPALPAMASFPSPLLCAPRPSARQPERRQTYTPAFRKYKNGR